MPDLPAESDIEPAEAARGLRLAVVPGVLPISRAALAPRTSPISRAVAGLPRMSRARHLRRHRQGRVDLADGGRLNARTVKMCRINRFLYWNMNYHVEHHMHPTVPFHSLDKLHQEIAHESPPPYRNTLEAWNELIRALWRQRREPTFSVQRPVPGKDGSARADGAAQDAAVASTATSNSVGSS